MVGQEYGEILRGPQTPKFIQPNLSLWIPLHLWFCKSPEYAFPVVCLTHGTKLIEIEIEKLKNLVYEVPVIHKYNIQNFKFIDAGEVFIPQGISGKIVKADLYINNYFLSKEIIVIFVQQVNLLLVRIHQHFINSGRNHSRIMARRKNMGIIQWNEYNIFIGAICI